MVAGLTMSSSLVMFQRVVVRLHDNAAWARRGDLLAVRPGRVKVHRTDTRST